MKNKDVKEEELQGKRIGYSPSVESEKFIDNWCGGANALLSRSQLIEIAIRFLFSQPEEVIDHAIIKAIKNRKNELHRGLYKEKISPSRQHIDEPQKKIV